MNPEDRQRAAEQWLDEALGSYRAAPPRLGLENRILAGLEAHARQRQRRWVLMLAAAAAVVVLAALATSRLASPRNASVALRNRPEPVYKTANTATAVAVTAHPVGNPVRERPVTRRKYRAARTVVLLAANSRPEHFPVPGTITEQQRRLQIYLSQTPRQEMALIAARQGPNIPDLNIPAIEIKDLTPKEKKSE